MSRKISNAIESFIHNEVAGRVKKERAALDEKLSEVSKKINSIEDEIETLEDAGYKPPADWKTKKRKIEKEFNIYFKKLRKQAVSHIKDILAKNGLTEGNSNSFEELATYFFESDDSLDWHNDVLPANDKADSTLEAKYKEYNKLDDEYSKINKEIAEIDSRVDKATEKICLQLLTGKNLKEVNDIIDDVIKTTKV